MITKNIPSCDFNDILWFNRRKCFLWLLPWVINQGIVPWIACPWVNKRYTYICRKSGYISHLTSNCFNMTIYSLAKITIKVLSFIPKILICIYIIYCNYIRGPSWPWWYGSWIYGKENKGIFLLYKFIICSSNGAIVIVW
jgi:hypothetical protein